MAAQVIVCVRCLKELKPEQYPWEARPIVAIINGDGICEVHLPEALIEES
jgi:hypothetical protein